MIAHLTAKSENAKVGPIPVSSTCMESCPPTCPLKGRGCYGAQGPIFTVWKRMREGTLGVAWDAFCKQVAALPDNQIWRHNQVGDLPGKDGLIDRPALAALVEANRGKRGWTYTHYDPRKGKNAEAIRHANENGFVVTLSADCLAHADALSEVGCGPVATILPRGHEGNAAVTPAGRKVRVCLAETVEYMTCAACKLCIKVGHPIVGFKTHGARFKTADKVFEEQSRRWLRKAA